MTRRVAAGTAALAVGAMMVFAGCGAGPMVQPGTGTGAKVTVPAQVSSPATTGGATSVRPSVGNGGAAMGGPCQSAYFGALQTAAKAKLPVHTSATAMTEWHGVGAATFAQALGVSADARALAGAFASTSAAGSPLTAQPKGQEGTWTFTVDGQTARLVVDDKDLGGSALTEARSFGPAWAGGSVQYQVAFPAGSLGGSPTLGAYLQQLAAQVAAGKADLTVVTGGVPQTPPTQYKAYWGPVNMGALTAAGSSASLCGSWAERTVYGYQTGGGIAPMTAEMVDIGNGGYVGFAAGQFVIESLHAGVDAETWYAVPGLTLVSGRR